MSIVSWQMFESEGAACPSITLLDLVWTGNAYATVGTSNTINIGANFTESATGGLAPYTLSVVSGSLPTGMVLQYNVAKLVWRINGTPTTFGSYTFTIGGTDANECAITPRSYTILVGEQFTENTPVPIPAFDTAVMSITVSGMPSVLGTGVQIFACAVNATIADLTDSAGNLLATDSATSNAFFNALTGANLSNTIFNTSSVTNITTASAPYTGNWSDKQIDVGMIAAFVGLNTNGTYQFNFNNQTAETGTIDSVTITFLPI